MTNCGTRVEFVYLASDLRAKMNLVKLSSVWSVSAAVISAESMSLRPALRMLGGFPEVDVDSS